MLMDAYQDELGNWRPDRNRFTQEYFDAYHACYPKSAPEEDYDDRNALYAMSVRYALINVRRCQLTQVTFNSQTIQPERSRAVPQKQHLPPYVRVPGLLRPELIGTSRVDCSRVIKEMQRLIARYPKGYEGSEPRADFV